MNKKFRIGDKVKVVGMSPATLASGMKDELGTEKLFKNMLGKDYTVRGFDGDGNVELQDERNECAEGYDTRAKGDSAIAGPSSRSPRSS